MHRLEGLQKHKQARIDWISIITMVVMITTGTALPLNTVITIFID